MWPFKPNPPPMTELQGLEYGASLGDAESQFKLGMFYNAGTRVPKNQAKGLALIQAAAEQGAAMASHSLSTIFMGLGDLQSGFKWLQTAAEQGLANAQAQLGIFYSMDMIVPQDDIKAGTWLTVAVANECPGGDEPLQKVLSRLSPTQKAEVQKLAAELTARLQKIPLYEHAERVGMI
jgi:Sel1 repeat